MREAYSLVYRCFTDGGSLVAVDNNGIIRQFEVAQERNLLADIRSKILAK